VYFKLLPLTKQLLLMLKLDIDPPEPCVRVDLQHLFLHRQTQIYYSSWDQKSLSDFPVVSFQSMELAISTRTEGEKIGTKNTNKLLVQGIRFPDKTNWEEKTVNEVDVKQWRE